MMAPNKRLFFSFFLWNTVSLHGGVGVIQAWVHPSNVLHKSVSLSRSSTVVFSSSAAAPQTDEITLDGEIIRGPITPLGNYVLVKTKDALSATDGGVFLPDQSKERPTEGTVLAAGPGKLHPHTGVRIHNPVQDGDSVLFGKFDGTSVLYNDEQCQMIRDDDVLLYYRDSPIMTLDAVVPCRDYVLVELQQDSLQTSSGIVVAASTQSDLLPCQGVVVKVGEGRLASKGEFTPSPVLVGDKVKFKDYAGNDVTIGGKEYSLVRMVDILCSYNDKDEEEAAAEE